MRGVSAEVPLTTSSSSVKLSLPTVIYTGVSLCIAAIQKCQNVDTAEVLVHEQHVSHQSMDRRHKDGRSRFAGDQQQSLGRTEWVHLYIQGVIWAVSLPLLLIGTQGECHAVSCGIDHCELCVACETMLSFDWTHVTKLGKANRNTSPAYSKQLILETASSKLCMH